MKLKSLYQTEKLHSRFKKSMIFLMTTVAMNTAFANPTGGAVTSGSATITNSGNTTTINQTSQQAIINWSSFNINSNQTTNFQQPTSGVALNRINPNQGASQIMGHLNATGEIILINSAGIHFGSSAMVNVGGIIASTSDISDSNFLAGNYTFDAPGASNASVINQGTIRAANYGLVALVGSNVTNSGYIQAEMGNVVLASGSKFTFSFTGDQLINFAVNGATTGTTNGNVTNSGTILADGGKVIVTARTAQNVLNDAIDMSGVAEANSVSSQNGVIVLDGGTGNVNVSGTLTAAGTANGTAGGKVQISGGNITLASNSALNVSGNTAGGSVLLTAANTTSVLGAITAQGLGTGALGGNIQINAVTINIGGSYASNSYYGNNGCCGGCCYQQNYVSAMLNASGDAGGGSIMLANVDSSGNLINASTINTYSGSTISADTETSGLAGSLTLYATNENISGTLSAQGNGSGTFGGNIDIYGNKIALTSATLSAEGDTFGGSVAIGGNPLATNTTTASISMDSNSSVSAGATAENGFGGSVTMNASSSYINGDVDVSGTNLGSFGGSIQFAGNSIEVGSQADITAQGNFFGGEIFVGSDPTFGLQTASITLDTGSILDASIESSNYSYSSAPNHYTNLCCGGGCGNGHGQVVVTTNFTDDGVGGFIRLYATNVNDNGTINVSGTAASTGDMGGEAEIFAANAINLGSHSQVLAQGDAGGGQVLIGGDLHGAGFDPDATNVTISAGSVINASALTNGIGGNVVVWSNNITNFSGTITAKGGASSGNGGDVEVAGGHQTIDHGSVSVSAPHGTAGTFLLNQ